ncbi:MAG: hypothetical protein KTR14_02795, partial [Vampirovibrio sp.]|nr:hypothetical protein [Vampirovibrio sp.]
VKPPSFFHAAQRVLTNQQAEGFDLSRLQEFPEGLKVSKHDNPGFLDRNETQFARSFNYRIGIQGLNMSSDLRSIVDAPGGIRDLVFDVASGRAFQQKPQRGFPYRPNSILLSGWEEPNSTGVNPLIELQLTDMEPSTRSGGYVDIHKFFQEKDGHIRPQDHFMESDRAAISLAEDFIFNRLGINKDAQVEALSPFEVSDLFQLDDKIA